MSYVLVDLSLFKNWDYDDINSYLTKLVESNCYNNAMDLVKHTKSHLNALGELEVSENAYDAIDAIDVISRKIDSLLHRLAEKGDLADYCVIQLNLPETSHIGIA